MADADGPMVAQSVYEFLLGKDKFSLEDVPYALDDAVQSLRTRGVPAHRWATFMHMGA
jgi:hypothetical protein